MVVDHDFAVFSGRVALGVKVEVVGHIGDKTEGTVPGFHGGVFEVIFLGKGVYGECIFLKVPFVGKSDCSLIYGWIGLSLGSFATAYGWTWRRSPRTRRKWQKGEAIWSGGAWDKKQILLWIGINFFLFLEKSNLK